MNGRWWRGLQQIVAAVILGTALVAAVPSVGQAAGAPAIVERQSQLPPTGLTPEQQEAFLESVSEQIFQGSADAGGRELIQAMVQEVRKCLVVELATGKTISQAAEACADVVQEAISPGSGSQPLSPEDQQWLAQADAGLRNRGKNLGWNETDTNNASMLTTGCIARFLKAGAPRQVGLQKCSFAFTIWEDARTVANAVGAP